LKPPPVKRLRGAYPHLLCSTHKYCLRNTLCPWHTVISKTSILQMCVGCPHRHCFCFLKHHIYRVKIDITEQRRDHTSLGKSISFNSRMTSLSSMRAATMLRSLSCLIVSKYAFKSTSITRVLREPIALATRCTAW